MKKLTSSLRQTITFIMLLTAMLLQGTIGATASNYNDDYAWDPGYIPKESPRNMEEIVDILEKNPDIFLNPMLNKGKGENAGVDTLSFYMVQYLDHFETDKTKLKYLYQLVTIVKFVDANHTTVMHTNGYDTANTGLYYCDLAMALDANMIEVEHRYQPYSRPSPDSFTQNGGFLQNENYWHYNRAGQQSADIAFVVNTLKKLKIFTGKWVSTGVSKSGMTTTFLAMDHPETCDVYVPFCAPFCKSLEEELSYWACEGYGKRLKELNEESYKKWLVTWQRAKDFTKNEDLREEMIDRKREELLEKYPLYLYEDEFCLTEIYTNYVNEMYDKAAYYQLEDWIDLMPSYVGPKDKVSKAYCDSMYLYLTINSDSLRAYVDKKKYGEASKSRIHFSRHFDERSMVNRLMNKRLMRRAAKKDPTTGLDSLILTLDPYRVQTMYELGNYVNDYSMFKEDLEALNGKNYLEKRKKEDMIFNFAGYKKIAQWIGLNTSDSPFMPYEPIEPRVKEFVKTTDAKVVFVYGGFDPWTEAGVKNEDIPATQTNISRFVVPGGTHSDSVLGKDYSWEAGFGNKIIDKVKELLGMSSGINTVQTESPAAQHPGVIYNLNGQRVSDSYKGIVIKNGKKIAK